jgi:hypothetical protein
MRLPDLLRLHPRGLGCAAVTEADTAGGCAAVGRRDGASAMAAGARVGRAARSTDGSDDRVFRVGVMAKAGPQTIAPPHFAQRARPVGALVLVARGEAPEPDELRVRAHDHGDRRRCHLAGVAFERGERAPGRQVRSGDRKPSVAFSRLRSATLSRTCAWHDPRSGSAR